MYTRNSFYIHTSGRLHIFWFVYILMIAGGQIPDDMCRQHFLLCEVVADYLYFSPVHIYTHMHSYIVHHVRKTAEVCNTPSSVCYIHTRPSWTGTLGDVIIISSSVLVPCLFLILFLFCFSFFFLLSYCPSSFELCFGSWYVVWRCIHVQLRNNNNISSVTGSTS